MSKNSMSMTKALESVNAQSSAVTRKWQTNIDIVNKARVEEGLQPMTSLTASTVATVLETFDKACKRAQALRTAGLSVTEATQPADVSFLRTHGINILTATMPSLIANEIVSIQPLQARVGEIRYLNVEFGNDKGRVKAGDTMFSNERVGGPTGEFGYSYDEVEGETVVFDETKTKFNAAWTPVVPGSIKLTVDGKALTDDGKGKIMEGQSEVGTIDYTSGAITLTTAATNVDDAIVNYQYNNITAPAQAPEMDLRVKGIPVIARARKLKTIMSFDAMYDLQAQYGFDSANEQATLVSQYLQYEIDGEIVQDLFRGASATTTTFSSTVPNAVSKLDHYEGFISTLNEASNNIFESTRFANGTYAVLGLDAATIVESLANRGFVASGQTGNGPHYIGQMGNYRMYKTPQLTYTTGASARDGYFIGYKGDTLFHAGYVYAPYMPIMTTDLLAQADFSVSQGYATSYAKHMVNAKLYSAGKITK